MEAPVIIHKLCYINLVTCFRKKYCMFNFIFNCFLQKSINKKLCFACTTLLQSECREWTPKFITEGFSSLYEYRELFKITFSLRLDSCKYTVIKSQSGSGDNDCSFDRRLDFPFCWINKTSTSRSLHTASEEVIGYCRLRKSICYDDECRAITAEKNASYKTTL